MDNSDVFVSYSHHDRQWVCEWLIPHLEGAGLRVCIDFRDFEIGKPAIINMENAVEMSQYTLLVITPNWLRSEWAEFEALLVQGKDPAARNARIKPLVLQACTLPDRLQMLTYADFRREELHDQEFTRLLKSLSIVRRLSPKFVPPYPLQRNFTGREETRKLFTEWYVKDEEPVLTVTALGGMGKSAVTWVWLKSDVLGEQVPHLLNNPSEAAHCRIPTPLRPNGVLWWSFYERGARFAEFARYALTYLSSGRNQQSSSTYEIVLALVDLLRSRKVLIILDGFERELRAYASTSASYQGDSLLLEDKEGFRSCSDPDASAFLRNIASAPMKSRILMTSRLFPVELEELSACRREELKQLAPEEALAFFRAQGIEGTRAEIYDACAAYGRHPLALRLLSGLILRDPEKPRDVSVADAYQPKLTPRKHDILQLSYDALDGALRVFLSRLAAFRSPLTYKEAAMMSPFKSETDLKQAIIELVDRGLLFIELEHVRYDLHPVVRRYAYDRLVDKSGVHTRLQNYFAALQAPNKIDKTEDLQAVTELYHHMVGAGHVKTALDLFHDRLFTPLFYQFSAYHVCIELLNALVKERGKNSLRLKTDSDRAWTLNALANCYSLIGNSRRAMELYEDQNTICEKINQHINLSVGLGNLAEDQMKMGLLHKAEQSARRQIALGTKFGDAHEAGVGRRILGLLLSYIGAVREAATEFDLALDFFTQLQDFRSIGIVWAYRATHYLLEKNAYEALAAARRASESANGFGYPRDIIRAEWLIGESIVAGNGLHKKAELHLDKALAGARRINLVELEADILLSRARLHWLQRQPERAYSEAKDSLSIADRCGFRLTQADVHCLLGKIALQQGDLGTATRHANMSLERAFCDGASSTYSSAVSRANDLLLQLGGNSQTAMVRPH